MGLALMIFGMFTFVAGLWGWIDLLAKSARFDPIAGAIRAVLVVGIMLGGAMLAAFTA